MTPSEERAVGGIYPRVGGDLEKTSPDLGFSFFRTGLKPVPTRELVILLSFPKSLNFPRCFFAQISRNLSDSIDFYPRPIFNLTARNEWELSGGTGAENQLFFA